MNSRSILLFLFTNILVFPVTKLHIMICNKCIGIKCEIHFLISICMSPPPLPPPMLPVFPQPPINQPLPYQAFVPPPPQPQNYPQMDARVDYST